jgi:hypothetical protein
MAAHRRWFQFSMRSFILLLTAFAVVLAVLANRAREQREAVAAIERAGGVVLYYGRANVKYLELDYDQDFLFHLFHTATCTTITSEELTEDICVEVARLPHLRMITLNGPITDAGLAELTALRKFEFLELDGTQITNAGVSHLQRMKSLYLLDLGQTPVTDANLRELARLTKLRKLCISRRGVTAKGLDYFERSLRKCEVKFSRR